MSVDSKTLIFKSELRLHTERKVDLGFADFGICGVFVDSHFRFPVIS